MRVEWLPTYKTVSELHRHPPAYKSRPITFHWTYDSQGEKIGFAIQFFKWRFYRRKVYVGLSKVEVR